MFDFLTNLFTKEQATPETALLVASDQQNFLDNGSEEVFNLYFFDPSTVLQDGYEFSVQLSTIDACHEYAKWAEKENYRIEKYDKANSVIVFET